MADQILASGAQAPQPPAQIDEQAAAEMLAAVRSCEPLFTSQQVDDIEKRHGNSEFSVGRRVGLAVGAMDGARFIEIIDNESQETARALANGADCIREYVQKTKQVLEWLEIAEMRLLTALAARDDFSEICRLDDEEREATSEGGVQ